MTKNIKRFLNTYLEHHKKSETHLAKDSHSPNFLCVLRYEVTANHFYEDNNLFEITFFTQLFHFLF